MLPCRKLADFSRIVTFQIQSALTHDDLHRTNSHFSFQSLFIWLQTNPTHQSRCVWKGLFGLCTSEMWMVDLARRWGEAFLRADVRPGMSREMARLDDSYRRTCFAKVGIGTCLHMRDGMCSFSNRWQRSGDWREKTEDRVREKGWQSVVFPSSLLVFMTLAFYLPLTAAWGPKRGKILFLFVPRRWFGTVTASSLEPCWPIVPLLLNVQR